MSPVLAFSAGTREVIRCIPLRYPSTGRTLQAGCSRQWPERLKTIGHEFPTKPLSWVSVGRVCCGVLSPMGQSNPPGRRHQLFSSEPT